MIKPSFVIDADGLFALELDASCQLLAELLHLPVADLHSFLKPHWQKLLIGELDLKTVLSSQLKSWHRSESTDNLLQAWFKKLYIDDQELLSLLQALSSHSLYCCANQEKYFSHYLYDTKKFKQIFEHCFFSSEMHRLKPTSDFFAYIWGSLEYFGDITSPSDVILVSLDPKCLKSASEFGFNTYLYRSVPTFINDLKVYFDINLKL